MRHAPLNCRALIVNEYDVLMSMLAPPNVLIVCACYNWSVYYFETACLQIVASLYMARSDVAYTVRSAALHVWKTIVSNTPRTLAEILPALMKSIISALASPGEPSTH